MAPERFELDAQAAPSKQRRLAMAPPKQVVRGAGEGEDLLASDDEGGFAAASRRLVSLRRNIAGIGRLFRGHDAFQRVLGFFAASAAAAVDGVHSPNRNDSQEDANAEAYRERSLSRTRRTDLQLLGLVQFLIIGSAPA